MSEVTRSTLKLKNRITKGHYGYIKRRKTGLLLGGGLLLLGAAGLFIIGKVATGTNKNWLTIFAVLTCIPMAMQFAVFFPMMKYKQRPKEEHDRIYAALGKWVFSEELIVPNRDGVAFYFPYVLVHENGIFAFCCNEKCEPDKIAEYIRNYLRLNNCDMEMTVIPDLSVFQRRIKNLPPSDRETCDESLLETEGVLRAISM